MLLVIVGSPSSGRKTALNWLAENLKYEIVDSCTIGAEGQHTWLAERLVATVPSNGGEAESLLQMPLAFALAIDAPYATRWKRARKQQPDLTLQQFVNLSDELVYGSPKTKGLITSMSAAQQYIVNEQSIQDLHQTLESVNLSSIGHARPSWDNYFIGLTVLTSRRTNCMKRAVGAVIVKNSRVVSTGYNGTPSGYPNCNEGGCARCNGFAQMGHSLNICFCLHAEENAIIEAGANRCEGATLYCSVFPCLGCTKQIIQAGIRKVVYLASYATDIRAKELLHSAGLEVHQCGFTSIQK